MEQEPRGSDAVRVKEKGRSMSETRFATVLKSARQARRAVGAFTCYGYEGLEAVLRAAEDRAAPVIILVSPASFKSRGGERLVQGFSAMARYSSIEALIQLDHVSDTAIIERAAESGAHAVMADGSRLPYSENLDFTRSVVQSLDERGVGVEAELGHVEGSEDEAGEITSGAMTEPSQSQAFQADSGADCLAIAVGNVHGRYSGEPILDWPRLQDISERHELPLSLHGASGLLEADLRRAVSLGVAKLNVNTELRGAYFRCLEEETKNKAAGLNVKALGDRLVGAIYEVVDAKLEAFGWQKGEA